MHPSCTHGDSLLDQVETPHAPRLGVWPSLQVVGYPGHKPCITPRSSSREVRIRVPTFVCVYFSRRTLPQKRVTGHYGGPSP